MAVILVSHRLGAIAGRADRAAVRHAGKAVETTSTLRLFVNPRHHLHRGSDGVAVMYVGKIVELSTRDDLYAKPGTGHQVACHFPEDTL